MSTLLFIALSLGPVTGGERAPSCHSHTRRNFYNRILYVVDHCTFGPYADIRSPNPAHPWWANHEGWSESIDLRRYRPPIHRGRLNCHYLSGYADKIELDKHRCDPEHYANLWRRQIDFRCVESDFRATRPEAPYVAPSEPCWWLERDWLPPAPDYERAAERYAFETQFGFWPPVGQCDYDGKCTR